MDFKIYFRSRQGEMISLLKELVLLESPTSDKKAVDACSAVLVDKFARLGAKVTRFPQKETGNFHYLEYPAKEDSRCDGRMLILTHIDTVWPLGKIESMPFYVQGDRVYGPGVLDMKAGLVLAYSAVKALRDLNRRPHRRLGLFINSAEETGCAEAHERIAALAKGADVVLCLEPALPGGALKVQRKGRLVLRFDVQGKSAHAGAPEKGVSAIDALLGVLRRMQMLRSKDISVNIGVIGGGEKVNVVADKAWALADVRFWTSAQKAKIVAFAKDLKAGQTNARVKASVESFTPPMERTKASTALFERAQEAAAKLGWALEGGKTGGGSDASIAAGLGKPTLDGLGPDGDGLHADHEHLLLPSFVDRAALLVELLQTL